MGLKDKIKAASLALGLLSCQHEEQKQTGYCMEELSESTGYPVEELSSLDCNNLIKNTDIFSNLPENYAIFPRDNFIVVGPDDCHIFYNKTRRQYLENVASELQTCYEEIKNYLGISPIMQCLVHTEDVDNDLSEVYDSLFLRGSGGAGCALFKSIVDPFEKDNLECKVEEPNEKECWGVHETAHLFVAGTALEPHENLSRWLNEGLADYLESKIRPGSSLECYKKSWSAISYNQDGKKFLRQGDYTNINDPNSVPMKTFATGSCIWKEIEERYGIETFRDIMRNLDAGRFDNSITLREILENTIGEEGINYLENRFNGYVNFD